MSKLGTITLREPDTSVSNKSPQPKEIAARAYEIFLKRGALEGHDVEDWLQAEMELTKE